MGLVGGAPLPLEDDGPGDGLQHQRHRSEGDDDANVGVPPFLVWVQDVEPLEHVDHAQYDHRVPNRVVVDVPVQPVLVILRRPQKQSKHLGVVHHQY